MKKIKKQFPVKILVVAILLAGTTLSCSGQKQVAYYTAVVVNISSSKDESKSQLRRSLDYKTWSCCKYQ